MELNKTAHTRVGRKMRCSMATNYQTGTLRMEGLNRGRGIPAFIRGERGLIAPKREVDEDAEEAFVRDYCPEQSPLGEAFGCGDDGITVFGDDEICARKRALFGFEDEDEQGQELAEIATRILAAYGYDDESIEDDDDVGMIVNVGSSDAQDYGIMITEILSARSIGELQEIVDVYADNMPAFARELAEICAKEYPNGGTLRFAS